MSQLKFYAGLFLITACTLMLQVLQTRCIRGSRSFGAKNVDPLQVIVFVGSPLTLFGLPLRG